MSRLMREGLSHRYPGVPDEELLKAIDATGGWPVGYQYIGFEHTEERKAGFCLSSHNDGWWTVVMSADDYYMWKLSPAALARIAAAAINRCAAVVKTTSPKELRVTNWRGRDATLTKESHDNQH